MFDCCFIELSFVQFISVLLVTTLRLAEVCLVPHQPRLNFISLHPELAMPTQICTKLFLLTSGSAICRTQALAEQSIFLYCSEQVPSGSRAPPCRSLTDSPELWRCSATTQESTNQDAQFDAGHPDRPHATTKQGMSKL